MNVSLVASIAFFFGLAAASLAVRLALADLSPRIADDSPSSQANARSKDHSDRDQHEDPRRRTARGRG